MQDYFQRAVNLLTESQQHMPEDWRARRDQLLAEISALSTSQPETVLLEDKGRTPDAPVITVGHPAPTTYQRIKHAFVESKSLGGLSLDEMEQIVLRAIAGEFDSNVRQRSDRPEGTSS